MVGKILIVEDNPLALELLHTILVADGHAVQTVTTGEMALKSAATAAIDLILLDIALPGIDGFEVCRRLKGNPETAPLPVIFISVSSQTEEKLKGFEAGGIDYIAKPFSEQEVLVRVRTQLKLAAVHREILEKNAELHREIAARKEAEEHFRILYEQCPDGIAVVDPFTLEFVTFNAFTHARLGYGREEFARLKLTDLIRNLDQETLLDIAVEVLQEGSAEFEGKDLCKNGEIRESLISARRLVLSGRPLLHLVVRDVTERNKMQEELIKTQRLESLGILAGGIAHDFNNLLTAVLGNVSLAKMQMSRHERTYQLLTKTELACLRARDLTGQLLTFAKGGEPVKKLTSLAQLVTESTSFVLSGTNVRCCFEMEEGLWNCEIDPGQIGQVMQNLVLNAQQAMPDGGVVTVSCRNLPGAGETAHRVEISVKDQGIGIPDEAKERIFDPFFSTKRSGSGLGLATSYSIVRKHAGTIEVQSGSKGSTFTLRLPAVRRETPLLTEAQLPAAARPLHILVMDDDEMVQEVLCDMLRGLGHQVEGCGDGRDVVRLYRDSMSMAKLYDCVIVDLTVPGGMGGREALRELKQLDPEVRVLASSGYASDSSFADCAGAGFAGALPKPYTVDALEEVLAGLFPARSTRGCPGAKATPC